MTYTTDDLAPIWVCHDCYFAHHYGAHEHEGEWYAGESDTPSDREPLGLIPDGPTVTDWTCSDHNGESDRWDDGGTPCTHCGQADDEDGEQSFSSSRCDGCGSTLGGSRYRLAIHPV